MGALPAHRRYHLLQRIAGSLYDRREEFARLMTGEAGKPIADWGTEDLVARAKAAEQAASMQPASASSVESAP